MNIPSRNNFAGVGKKLPRNYLVSVSWPCSNEEEKRHPARQSCHCLEPVDSVHTLLDHAIMQLIHNSQIWGPFYLKQRLRQITQRAAPPLQRIWVTIADHYEPRWRHADLRTAQSRVA